MCVYMYVFVFVFLWACARTCVYVWVVSGGLRSSAKALWVCGGLRSSAIVGLQVSARVLERERGFGERKIEGEYI